MGKEKAVYEIKYIPTGNIFKLPKAECDRLAREESANFKVVDKDYVLPVEEVKDTPVYQKVVEGNVNLTPNAPVDLNKDLQPNPAIQVKSLKDYNYNELKAYAKNHGLKQNGNTDELRARCIEHSIAECNENKAVKDAADENVATKVVEG